MSNVRVTIDSEILKKARLRAFSEGTTVNELLRKVLRSYAGVWVDRAAAIDDLIQLSQRARSRSNSRRWSRDQLHQRLTR